MPRTLRVAMLTIVVGGLSILAPSGVVLATTPVNQKVVNLTSTAASIVWDTSVSETATVNYGTTCGTNDSGLTFTGGSDAGNGYVHVVPITGLAGFTTYFYDIVSGGTTYDNGGTCYSLKTLPAGGPPPPPQDAAGHVFNGSGCTTPLTTGIVTVVDANGASTSQTNEAAINGSGSGNPGAYGVPYTPIPSEDSTGYFSVIPGNTTITVTADTGQQQATVSVVWSGSTPQDMPNICLSTTAVAYSRLTVHRARGTTSVRWRATRPVLGFNIFDGHHKLNRTLVVSRTHWYTFHTAQIIRRLRLSAVTR